MSYWSCFYHVVWATKYRQETITRSIQPTIYDAIAQKSTQLGCKILAINSVADHIHVAISIPPHIAVAKWVGDAKGLSTYAVNGNYCDLELTFKWQEGYGVVTFGEKNFPYVEHYIARQQEHHQSGHIVEKLERIDELETE